MKTYSITNPEDKPTAMKLPAYRVTYDDGESYVTRMAAGITLAMAQAYFVGKTLVTHECFVTGKETKKTITKVEPA